MGIATGQWRASIGSWQARFRFQLSGANTNSFSISSTIFYALVLSVLLIVGGVEINPGPNSQSCCELCGVNPDTMKERELALQQREAACDLREQHLEQREALLQSKEAAVWKRENVEVEKEKSSGTPAVNQEPGGVDVVRSLLEEGLVSKTGLLLEWAVLKSYISIVQFLIEEAKMDVNAKNSSGRSVLFLAVEHGVLAAVELLLPLSREDIVDSTGELAFHSAVSKGHTEVVKCLIVDSRALVRKRNKNGFTAHHLTAWNGHLDLVKLLFHEVGADFKSNYGSSALHCAAREGHIDIVKFLVQEAHSDVEAKNNSGCTALHYAALYSHFPVAEFLVQEAQADVGSKDSRGRTALQLSTSTEIKNLLRQSS